MLINRAVHVSRVCSLAPLPVIDLESALFRPEVKVLCIDTVVGLNVLEYLARVVVCHVLLASASDSVVMLGDTDSILHVISRFQSILEEILLLCFEIKCVHSEEH